jgi:hypothetical protein
MGLAEIRIINKLRMLKYIFKVEVIKDCACALCRLPILIEKLITWNKI